MVLPDAIFPLVEHRSSLSEKPGVPQSFPGLYQGTSSDVPLPSISTTVILSEVDVREADDKRSRVEALSGRLSPLPKSRAKSRELTQQWRFREFLTVQAAS